MRKVVKVKEVMVPIEEYALIHGESRLCDALGIWRSNEDKVQAGDIETIHHTLFVTDSFGKIIGKLSMYDLIRGLVPDHAKEAETSKGPASRLPSRAREVAEQVGEAQERFEWLHHTLFDLVQQETQKKVKDVMSPVSLSLKEEDSLNKAMYIMFKNNIRQPLVVRDGEVVGVVNFRHIYPLLLEIAGDECFLI